MGIFVSSRESSGGKQRVELELLPIHFTHWTRSIMAYRRQKLDFAENESGGWIPGLGDNKPRPRELGGSFFGYVPEFESNNLPELPSESSRSQRSTGSSIIFDADHDSSSRSESPRPGSETAMASDSSQMSAIMWT